VEIDVDSGAPDRSVISVKGDIDAYGGHALRDAITDSIELDHDVIIDLSEVDFVDSAGVGVLVGAHRAAQKAGRRFAIRRPSHRVSVLLEVTGLNRLFAIEEGA
jgi:anti-sigma B factor antagonist